MNYISEINSFYDWLETNNLPKSAISLWHALMHIANKARWPESFAVAMSTIESKTGFKRSELFKARNVLQQKGRLLWRERAGNQSAEYKMLPLCVRIVDTNTNNGIQQANGSVHNTDALGDANRYDVRTQTPTQTGTISKQDYTDTKQDISTANAVTPAANSDPPENPKPKRKKSSAQKKERHDGALEGAG